MKKIFVFLMIFVSLKAFSQASDKERELSDRLRLLEDKIDEMEIEKTFNRFTISGTYINYFEEISSKEIDPSKRVQHDNGNVASMHLSLNVDFKVSNEIDFFSTIGMGKVWNNDGRDEKAEASSYRSNQGSYAYSGSEAKFDVAYVRWRLPPSQLTLAFGRMTTNGGPPQNQLDGLYRNGTYPRFGYNAIFDGVAIIYDFKEILPEYLGYKTRLFYTPYFFLSNEERVKPAEDADGNEIKRKSDQITWLNEFELKGVPFADKISLYSMLWYYDDFYDSDYQTEGNSTVEYYRALSHTTYLGLEGIAHTPLNFSWSYLTVRSKSTGDEERLSNAHLFNINYTFNSKFVVGIEHIATDKQYYIDEWTYLRFNDFYQRPSNNGQHYFIAYNLPSKQVIRLGLFDYRAEKAPLMLYENKQRTQNIYLSYRLDF